MQASSNVGAAVGVARPLHVLKRQRCQRRAGQPGRQRLGGRPRLAGAARPARCLAAKAGLRRRQGNRRAGGSPLQPGQCTPSPMAAVPAQHNWMHHGTGVRHRLHHAPAPPRPAGRDGAAPKAGSQPPWPPPRGGCRPAPAGRASPPQLPGSPPQPPAQRPAQPPPRQHTRSRGGKRATWPPPQPPPAAGRRPAARRWRQRRSRSRRPPQQPPAGACTAAAPLLPPPAADRRSPLRQPAGGRVWWLALSGCGGGSGACSERGMAGAQPGQHKRSGATMNHAEPTDPAWLASLVSTASLPHSSLRMMTDASMPLPAHLPRAPRLRSSQRTAAT